MVRELGKFIRAMIGKWRWNLICDRGKLWCRVIRVKYRDLVPSQASSWWKGLILLCFREGEGSWFDEGIRQRIGEGDEVLFWEDKWLGDAPFS